jgi:hypothetical protein
MVYEAIHHLEKRIAATENRLAKAEDSLNDIIKIIDQVRTRLIDYGMKALWIMIGGACLYGSFAVHYFIK